MRSQPAPGLAVEPHDARALLERRVPDAVAGGRWSATFAMRRTSETSLGSPHTGVDLAPRAGSEVDRGRRRHAWRWWPTGPGAEDRRRRPRLRPLHVLLRPRRGVRRRGQWVKRGTVLGRMPDSSKARAALRRAAGRRPGRSGEPARHHAEGSRRSAARSARPRKRRTARATTTSEIGQARDLTRGSDSPAHRRPAARGRPLAALRQRQAARAPRRRDAGRAQPRAASRVRRRRRLRRRRRRLRPSGCARSSLPMPPPARGLSAASSGRCCARASACSCCPATRRCVRADTLAAVARLGASPRAARSWCAAAAGSSRWSRSIRARLCRCSPLR